MKKQINSISGAILALIASIVINGVAIASPAVGNRGDYASNGKSFSGAITPANSRTYRIGKEFALAIDDSKSMDTDDDAFNYTIVDLVYLIDSLEGQSEAITLQGLLKEVVRGTKDSDLVSAEIESVSKAYFARQTAEQKWYFNVGNSQMNLLLAGWANDGAGIKTRLVELQRLAKTAPNGAPATVVNAINGLSKYIAKVTFTKDDYMAIITDTKNITTVVYA